MQQEPHHTSVREPEHVAPLITRSAALEALKDGPRGALAIAAWAVGLLFIGWLFFYFVLFIRRGYVG